MRLDSITSNFLLSPSILSILLSFSLFLLVLCSFQVSSAVDLYRPVFFCVCWILLCCCPSLCTVPLIDNCHFLGFRCLNSRYTPYSFLFHAWSLALNVKSTIITNLSACRSSSRFHSFSDKVANQTSDSDDFAQHQGKRISLYLWVSIIRRISINAHVLNNTSAIVAPAFSGF